MAHYTTLTRRVGTRLVSGFLLLTPNVSMTPMEWIRVVTLRRLIDYTTYLILHLYNTFKRPILIIYT